MSFQEALSHAPLEEIFDDAWFLHGTVKMGPGMVINRNMVVLRHDGELTVVNPVRMQDDSALEKLGKVSHAVRLGSFHAMDDRYYVEKLGAKFWCQEGMDNPAREPDEVITDGRAGPVPDSKLLVFREAKKPECALYLGRGPGLLVTCDAVQHHVAKTQCSFLAKGVMSLMGFMRPMNIGPPWRKMMTKEGGSLEPDFRRLLELDFDYAAGGHGQVCRGGAKEALAATVSDVFG